jgi:hypothetical protein
MVRRMDGRVAEAAGVTILSTPTTMTVVASASLPVAAPAAAVVAVPALL